MQKVKLSKLVYFIFLIFFLLNGCKEEHFVPEPEDIYIFPYKSEVDALALQCGYEKYEEQTDFSFN